MVDVDIRIAPEVEKALKGKKPVVALETTLIAFGLPAPDNLTVALELEEVVRKGGAVPAAIAVVDGVPHVGLTDREFQKIAGGPAHGVVKASRRDLPILFATKGIGATTVAATMTIAHRAGIRVFATGGIGGAHRGAQKTFDISGDIAEFARTPVAVVSSGAKALLDLRLTLELLETAGVPVVGYKTDRFPAFTARDSGLKVSSRLDTPKKLALAAQAAFAMGMGILIANPVPKGDEIEPSENETIIEAALADLANSRITGADATPFVLERMRVRSKGKTVKANRSLLLANCALAAELATELAAAR